LHGQSFDLGGLPLTTGFALELGPTFAAVIGLAVVLTFLEVGRRGGWLASGRECSQGRTPRKGKGEGIGGPAPRRCAGESAGTRARLQTGTTRCRDGVTGSGSPLMGPKTLPGSESPTGKTQWSLSHHGSTESRHTPSRLKMTQPRFLGDGVLAERE
jgi:hypothetical protein